MKHVPPPKWLIGVVFADWMLVVAYSITLTLFERTLLLMLSAFLIIAIDFWIYGPRQEK